MRRLAFVAVLGLVALCVLHASAIPADRAKSPLYRLAKRIEAPALIQESQVSEGSEESSGSAENSGSSEGGSAESGESGSLGSSLESSTGGGSEASSTLMPGAESSLGSGSGESSLSLSDSSASSHSSVDSSASGALNPPSSYSSSSLSSSSASLSSTNTASAMGSSNPMSSATMPVAGTTNSADEEARARHEAEERAQRERELDWARHRKDAEEQHGKKERLLQMKMVEELKKARLDADASARRILADAQAKAKEMLDNAKPPAAPVDEKKKAEEDAKNSILLKPANTGSGDEAIDPQSLGLAPSMSVETNLISHASKLAKKADLRHEKFEDQHEIDCKGPICGGKGGGKVVADAH